ncbi:MAG: hypothetical protein Q4G64_01980 [bacterium]|nr:hypothetical protein [bacterium]
MDSQRASNTGVGGAPPEQPNQPDLVGGILAGLVAIGVVANAVLSFSGTDILVSAVVGAVTVALIVLLIRHHLRRRAR